MSKKIFILPILLALYSCQSVKDALQGKKYESSDEFLVIKKNPLVLPPDFNLLPEPNDPEKKTREEKVEEEIEDILSSIKTSDQNSQEVNSITESKSTEDFVLDQLKSK